MKSIIIMRSSFKHQKGTYLRLIDDPKILFTFIVGNIYLVQDEVAAALIQNDEARIYQGSYYGQRYNALEMVA